MRSLFRVLLVLLFAALPAQADETYAEMQAAWVKKSFVIVGTTKDYPTALKIAKDAAKKLNIKLDLRGLKSVKATYPLSFDKSVCEKHGFDYPCYVHRGRWDEGVFVSIEFTTAYKDLTPGYLMVVLAVGPTDADYISQTLTKAKAHFPDAYRKNARVYMGGIH